MNYFTEKNSLKLLFLTLCLFNINSIKSQNVVVNQDLKFEQLLNEKRKVNSSITINNRYKIQIFNGNSEASKKTLIQFKKENKSYDATIIFNTPFYKVWVGNFKTRIEAERNLNLLKKKYPNAILIKPSKI
ncbi:SPOR domain-containing protein [Flavobacterium sp.]|uniref:SPOR domain-containing protein n=1 Tax=Flavobacterium sp. TaxID=239 RepID=UPI00261CF9B7|nr:SPOR domain-containing protein [Flavobacterium sp.]